MKIWDLILLAQSNLWRNKMRTILTTVAFFIGAFAVILISGINSGVNSYIDKQSAAAGGEDVVVFAKGSDSMGVQVSGLPTNQVSEYNEKVETNQYGIQVLSKDDMAKLHKTDGLENVSPIYNLKTEYVASGKNSKKFQITAAYNSDAYVVDLAAGEMISDKTSEPEIVLESKYVEPLGFSSAADLAGKKVRIAVKNQVSGEVSEFEIKVAGVMNPTVVNLGQNLLNRAAQEKLYAIQTRDLPPEMTDFAMSAIGRLAPEYLKDSEKMENMRSQLKKNNIQMITNDEMVGIIKSFFSAMTAVLIAFGAIALLVASIGIVNTLLMSVKERTREIGLMKSLGLSNFRVFLLFSCEAIILSFWGGILGILAAFLVAHFANMAAANTFLADLPGFTLIELNWVNLLVIVATLMLIGFVAGTMPAWRAAKKNPIDALRYE